ncbi:MAG: anthrone oxygenase family protein [Janthinobacterium lividum]
MQPFVPRVVSYLAVLMSGLVAGLLFGTVVDHAKLRVLDGPSWVVARQSIDSVFSVIMPWLWNTTLVLLVAAAYLHHGRTRGLFTAAALILLAGIVVTLIVEVPINKQIASWTATSIAPDWAVLRERWIHFHAIRMAAGVAAFVCALLAQ